MPLLKARLNKQKGIPLLYLKLLCIQITSPENEKVNSVKCIKLELQKERSQPVIYALIFTVPISFLKSLISNPFSWKLPNIQTKSIKMPKVKK